jgi:glycosyltransferase involved in cell wall biosynthesis
VEGKIVAGLTPPLVSVIIPVFNRPRSLMNAVQSIQDNKTIIEIIIIDDASTDKTLATAINLQKMHPNIRVVSNFRSKGAQGARNSGIILAQGELIVFLDSDDIYTASAIDTLVGEWTEFKDPECWLVSGRLSMSQSGESLHEVIQNDKTLIYSRPIPGFGGWIVPRKNLIEIGLLHEKILAYQEWDTAFRLVERFPVKVSETITYVWVFGNKDSISSKKLKSKISYVSICLANRRIIRKVSGNRSFLKSILIGLLK